MYDDTAVHIELVKQGMQITLGTLQEADEEIEVQKAPLRKYEEVYDEKQEDFIARIKVQPIVYKGRA